jgi:hypothetical protein
MPVDSDPVSLRNVFVIRRRRNGPYIPREDVQDASDCLDDADHLGGTCIELNILQDFVFRYMLAASGFDRKSILPHPYSISFAFSQALVISYIPVMGHKLPFSMSPEYQAAQRAYMRYHNMNPIFGISSKQARATQSE